MPIIISMLEAGYRYRNITHTHPYTLHHYSDSFSHWNRISITNCKCKCKCRCRRRRRGRRDTMVLGEGGGNVVVVVNNTDGSMLCGCNRCWTLLSRPLIAASTTILAFPRVLQELELLVYYCGFHQYTHTQLLQFTRPNSSHLTYFFRSFRSSLCVSEALLLLS